MKVLVCGGRNYDDFAFVVQSLNKINEFNPITLIIEGGANGADRLGRDWANCYSIPVQTFEADWITFGKGAGFKRNAQMLNEGQPDIVVAFPGGNGTAHMVRISKAANVMVWEPAKSIDNSSSFD